MNYLEHRPIAAWVTRYIAVGILALGVSFAIPAPAQADNSCVWAFDGDCDDPTAPGAITSACSPNTDDADCGVIPTGGPLIVTGPSTGGGGGPNSCFPNDGDCDEPNGLNNCPFGTDTNDCSNPGSNFGSGSGFAGGGGGSFAGLHNPCPFTNDGDCDEPNGLNLCAWGTDRTDCSNSRSNFGGGSGWVASSAPRAPAIVSTQEGIQIQTALNYFGFNAGFVDGQIGARTRAGITRFQVAMLYPGTGSMAADQLGLLLGAYSWATTQGGAAQTGQGGIPLLQAYRARLAGTLAPVAPLVGAPTSVRAVRPTRPRGGVSSFAGVTAGGNPATCPTPQNSDGFLVNYAGYQAAVSISMQGDTLSETTALDGSFMYDIVTNDMGMTVLTADVDAQGNDVPGTYFQYTYNGPAIPAMQVGSLWQGTSVVMDVNNVVTGGEAVRAEIFDEVPADFGPCSYTALRGVVTRTDTTTGLESDEYFLHFPQFGVSLYVGYATTPGQVIGDDPISIEIRADDGFGPPIGGAGIVARPRP